MLVVPEIDGAILMTLVKSPVSGTASSIYGREMMDCGWDESTEALVSAWCHRLKHEGGAKVLASLRERNREAMDAPMQAAYDDALTYFGNHWERMKYPEYLARGWQIGSGSVESACKNVVNQRLSMGGMRWGESGADAVAHLRALFRSEESQWEAFWCLPA